MMYAGARVKENMDKAVGGRLSNETGLSLLHTTHPRQYEIDSASALLTMVFGFLLILHVQNIILKYRSHQSRMTEEVKCIYWKELILPRLPSGS